ncbi:MAG: HDOD domain-containing protein [Pseudomonadota bacterium]
MNAHAPASVLAETLNHLPALPEVASEILTRLNDEFVTGKQVAEVVGKDPGISARLVALANSAYFGLSEPVGNLEQVVNRVLGVDNVRSLALALAAGHVLDTSSCDGFNTRRFWENALLMADATARIVADEKKATQADKDLAYQTGLCHNIGLLALAALKPETTSNILSLRDAEPEAKKALAPLLRAAFGVDHRELTHAVACAWKLPEASVLAFEPVSTSSSLLHYALDVARMAVADPIEPTVAPDQQDDRLSVAEAIAPSARYRQRVAAMVEGISAD